MMNPRWWRQLKEQIFPPRKLRIVEGDSLPSALPRRDIVLARDKDEDWCVGMRCPCGCKQVIELLLIPDVKPRWELQVNSSGQATLHPSIWLQTGCRSHFWLREGRILWCE